MSTRAKTELRTKVPSFFFLFPVSYFDIVRSARSSIPDDVFSPSSTLIKFTVLTYKMLINNMYYTIFSELCFKHLHVFK